MKVNLNGTWVSAADGATLLDVARAAGVEVPTLCYGEGRPATPSCMLCVVEADGVPVPACATRARDDMVVQTESARLLDLRRSAVELLLAEHLGDCMGPCSAACPIQLDVPSMLLHLSAERLDEAAATVRASHGLPRTLAHLCHAPCETACRRGRLDEPGAIQRLERYAAAAPDAAPGPPPGVATGTPRRAQRAVAIVGGGPTGLSAAFRFLMLGYRCTVFERAGELGGSLREQVSAGALPDALLEADLTALRQLGAEVRTETCVGEDVTVLELCGEYDAVVLASGSDDPARNEHGLDLSEGFVCIDPATLETSVKDVFAGGSAVEPVERLVQAWAWGHSLAEAVSRRLDGAEPAPAPGQYASRAGTVALDDLVQLAQRAPHGPAAGEPASAQEAAREASRCLECACGGADGCELRTLASRYGVRRGRYAVQRGALVRDRSHPEVVFEPGKCIGCGACVHAAREASEPVGLAILGRGAQRRVGPPPGATMAEALTRSARACVAACPTGALSLRR
jgi:ferredoxin